MPDYDQLSVLYERLQAGEDAERLAASAAALAEMHGRTSPGRGDGRGGRRLLLDLGCGTGAFGRRMALRGYDVVGIDASEGMLRRAVEQGSPAGADILYLRQDITRFELFGTVDAICCLTDTVNHVATEAALRRMLRLCRLYLNPDGVLVFDALTRRHFARRLGNRTIHEVTDDAVLLWCNRFLPKSGRNIADIVVFGRTADGAWTRGDECIVERAYPRRSLERFASDAGFLPPLVLDAVRGGPAGRTAERLFFVCRPDPASTLGQRPPATPPGKAVR